MTLRPSFAARSRAADSPSGSTPARAKGLFVACPRGGVYRQRQGALSVRVRLQGLDCHAGHRPQGRAGRAARQAVDDHGRRVFDDGFGLKSYTQSTFVW
jgi:hypothetical protein